MELEKSDLSVPILFVFLVDFLDLSIDVSASIFCVSKSFKLSQFEEKDPSFCSVPRRRDYIDITNHEK